MSGFGAERAVPGAVATAILCRGLTKRYGDVVAVDGLDLEVRVGECFGLLGPNGAGKTTTVEILQGLVPADAGAVTILGMTWERDAAELRQRLGSQLQETKLADKLTVRETLKLFRSFYRRGRSVEEVMEMVGLSEKRDTWVVKLSGGQRQRLAVGCALVCEPEILFLDEPTTGLDPQSRRQLWGVIAEFRQRGGTVLLTTHYMEEAERLCDRVAVMDRGRIIALGAPRELVASLGAEHVVEFGLADGGRLDEGDLRRLPGVVNVRTADGKTYLTVRRVHETVPALMQLLAVSGAALSELTTHHATLEDVFLSLTGRHLRDE
ncbi:Daunorubicin/doxorubicin resistance ATP-binding protein DrrA [bacterium HR33]|nr:Daunorubicin/doxorubicin resistance ATP-binding protein DrrA [bacterium HR33]